MTQPNHQRIETASMPWETQAQGVARITLAEGVGSQGPGDPGVQISMLRLGAGKSLPTADCDREILVCDGALQLGETTLGKNSYARLPSDHSVASSTSTGATLLLRTGPFASGDRGFVQTVAEQTAWRPGQGNLRVQPLHNHGDCGTALVHWPADERFVPHRHWGGEEIFVLSGTFEDEHGRYPTGTWLLSPHLSAHHPFVTEETIIFVKTGHLPQQ